LQLSSWQDAEKFGSIVVFKFKCFNTLHKSCLLNWKICRKGGDQ